MYWCAARGAQETCKALLGNSAVSGALMYRQKVCISEEVDNRSFCDCKAIVNTGQYACSM